MGAARLVPACIRPLGTKSLIEGGKSICRFGFYGGKVMSLMSYSSARGMPVSTIAGGGWHAPEQTVGEDGVKDGER